MAINEKNGSFGIVWWEVQNRDMAGTLVLNKAEILSFEGIGLPFSR